jgi:hypothetical protein
MKMNLCYNWQIGLALLAYCAALCNASAFYDPCQQRWLNRDPNGEKGGIDLYEYVANDSLDKIDPEGLSPDEYGNVLTTCTKTGQRTGNLCQYRCNCPSGFSLGFDNPYSTRPCDGPAPVRICVPNHPPPSQCPISGPSQQQVKKICTWTIVGGLLVWGCRIIIVIVAA